MSDSMAPPIATSTSNWPRRLRRVALTVAVVAGFAVASWSLFEMAGHDGLVVEIEGYRISASIDDQMMLLLAISNVETVPPAIRANDLFSSEVEGTSEADYVYYDSEGEDDEMVDTPVDYQVAGQRHAAPKS